MSVMWGKALEGRGQGLGRSITLFWMVPLVSLLVVSIAERAAACGACRCPTPPRILPSGLRSTEVPLNARFMVELRSFDTSSKVRLLPPESVRWIEDDSLNLVEFELKDSGNGHQFWIASSEMLRPETRYTLELHNANGVIAGESFRTGTVEDHAPPYASELETDLPGDDDECPRHAMNFGWTSIDDDGRPLTYSPIVEVSVERESGADLLFVDGSETQGKWRALFASSEAPEAGSCWGSALLPFPPHEEPLAVAVSIYDSAGNKLALAPTTAQLMRRDTGGCPGGPRACAWRAGPTSGGAGGLLALSLFGLLLRRRSSPSSAASTK